MIVIPGGTGKIGREAVKALHILEPEARLIVGSRHDPGGNECWRFLDGNDPQSIDAFLEGASLILNVMGPSELTSPRILAAAEKRGIPMVDVGDASCYRRFEEEGRSARREPGTGALLSGCGSVPGLIGLLPLVLAEEFDRIDDLSVYYMIEEEISLSASRDMAFALRPESLSGNPTATLTKAEALPFFGEEVYRYPYYDKECELLEKILLLKKSSWYMIRPDQEYEKLLSRAFKDREELARKISTLSKFQSGQQKPRILFSVEMQGILKERKKPGIKLLYAASRDPAALSGKVAASVTSALYHNPNIRGYYRPISFPAREKLLKNLRGLNPFTDWKVYPRFFQSDVEEEGEL